MALVVFLRGINVGGHRSFRPSQLAQSLRRFGAVNLGAAGTLIIIQPVSQTTLRAELTRRLPFDASIMICQGRDIVRLMSDNPFVGRAIRPEEIRFVSIMPRAPRTLPARPVRMPATGPWLVKVLATDGRYIFGLYRRHMKVIGYLGQLDQVFGAPVTTRSWSTIEAIVRILGAGRD